MNWNKLKTFLIVLFSAINIFLIITMLTKDYKESVVPDATIQDTVEILNKRGITVDKALIPDKAKNMEAFSMQTLDVKKLSSDVSLLGGRAFEFTVKENVSDADDIEDILEDRGIQYAEFVSDVRNLSSLKAVEEIDGYRIFGSYLDISVSGGITTIKGAWLSPSSEPQSGEGDIEPTHVTSILIDYISNPERPSGAHTITGIDFGYYVPEYVLSENVQTVSAVPSWQITLDSGAKFYYDARNGEYLK